MSCFLGTVTRTENERGTFFDFSPFGELTQEGVHLLTAQELHDLFRRSEWKDLQFTCHRDGVPEEYRQFLEHVVAMDIPDMERWFQEGRRRYAIRQRDVLQMYNHRQIQTLPFDCEPDLDALADFRREQAELTQAAETLRQQCGELTRQTAGLEETRGRIQEELQTLEPCRESLQNQVRELEEKKARLESQTASLEEQQAKLEAYFQDVKANPLAKLGTLAADGQLMDWMQQAPPKQQRTMEPFSCYSYRNSCPNLAEALCQRVREFRPNYSCLDILNIAVCLTQGFLTVFFGAPGCGKTSICNIFARVLGLYAPEGTQKAARYVPVSVERGWMSKRDFIGYFNPLTGTFGSSNRQVYDALRYLHTEESVKQITQEGGDPVQYAPIPFLILLDEANLSAMEYYWADFMNLCEDSLTEGQLIQSDGTRRKIRGTVNLGEEQLEIPDWLRFAATINTDHTTETLSPRLLDRAWLVSLPPADEFLNVNVPPPLEPLRVSWLELQDAFGGHGEPWPDGVQAMFADLAACLQKECKVAVSHRVRLAVRNYWSGAVRAFASVWPREGADCGYANAAAAALDYAVAQRVLPQLQGSGADFADRLTALQDKCAGYGLRKSAAIVQDVRERGEEAEYFQFF